MKATDTDEDEENQKRKEWRKSLLLKKKVAMFGVEEEGIKNEGEKVSIGQRGKKVAKFKVEI